MNMINYDLIGQERFGNMTRVYYKDAIGCFIVCDVTRKSTLEGAKLWKADFDRKVTVIGGSPVPCVLLANKVGQCYLTYMFHVNLMEHVIITPPPPYFHVVNCI
jgi:Ras-related protein Rab-32